jgi:mitochondrial fission protein ELM1
LTRPSTWVLSEAYAGLQAQALGLAEAAGLTPAMRVLTPRAPWRFLPAARWPAPLRVMREAIQPPLPELIVGCGGVAAAVGAALRRPGLAVVQVQNPRLDPRRFDMIVANRHDELTGPNVVVTRTALHRATPARLAQAAEAWRERLADLPRPLVSVLVGGSNGRFRLDAPVATALATQLAEMMQRDGVGVALTPSRRTDPAAIRALSAALEPLGGWVWNGEGDNPYFGLLALADAVVVTMDSVSMVSEAAATSAPVLVAPLPGKSRRIGLFLDGLLEDGRIRPFTGRLETWSAEPLDDTPVAAAEMRRRLGF